MQTSFHSDFDLPLTLPLTFSGTKVAVGILRIQLRGVCNVDAVGLGLLECTYVVCHHYHVQLACC